jgi:hypothetical protein
MVTTRRASQPKAADKVTKDIKKEAEEMVVEKTEEEKLEEKRQLTVEDIKAQIKEIEKAKEPRQVSKVIISESLEMICICSYNKVATAFFLL